MRKSVIFGCVLVIGMFQLAVAGGSHDGVTDKYGKPTERSNFDQGVGLPDEVGEFAQQVAGAVQAGGGAPSSNPMFTDCVVVDLELSDTVQSSNPSWPGMVEGYFQLTNCGLEAAEVMVGLQVTVHIPGRVDTTLVFPEVAIVMDSGEVIYRELMFPLPPFEASYTFCVTASSGEATSYDCETVVVSGTPNPGIPFSAPGVLVQGTNCVLFSPAFGMVYNDPEFVLENYGEFSVGDTVLVNGLLDPICETECEGADGCVYDNTIEEYGPPPPPGQPFGGCGVLVQGFECLLFSIWPDSLGEVLLALDNYGQFGVGDSVFVFGYLDPDCESFCAGPAGCLRDNTIEPCNTPPPPPGYYIEACGMLLPGTGCIIFMPFRMDPAAPSFVLEDYGVYGVYDTVYVTGYAVSDSLPVCPEATGIIVGNTIDPCGSAPPPPGEPFGGCGVLVQGFECVLFSIWPDTLDEMLLALDNYGPYGVGDTVFVFGFIDPACTTACVDATACLKDNTIEPCNTPPPPPPGYPFDGCGILVQGAECVLFAPMPDSSTILFQLDDLGPFGVGDTVHVYGWLYFDCATTCMEAVACLIDSTIELCQTQPPPPPPPGYRIEACGILLPGTGCTIFTPLSMGPAAPSFVLQNYGDFEVFDSVFVTGFAVPDSFTICPEAAGVIVDNTIEWCQTPPPPPPGYQIEACGVLLPGTGCVFFMPFTMGPIAPAFVLENYGDYGVFDTVYVTGYAAPDSLIACPEAAGVIFGNTIEPCGGTPPPPGGPFEGCGILIQGTSCVLFDAIIGDQQMLFSLQDYGTFGVYDTVFVSGMLVPDTSCGENVGMVVDNVIAECNSTPLAAVAGIGNYPNPFNPSTTIFFDLDQSSQVKVTVYNMLGEVVRVLSEGVLPAGRQEISWNGTDGNGTSVASGVYFYRVESERVSETRKMMLIK
jgi:hypothetical protein